MLNSFMTSKWMESEGQSKMEKNELTCKIGQRTHNDDKQNKSDTED
jgi:hypothetical protein